MSDWFSPEGLKTLIAACVFLSGIAGYFGWDAKQAAHETQMTREQVTRIVNHYYQNCGPEDTQDTSR